MTGVDNALLRQLQSALASLDSSEEKREWQRGEIDKLRRMIDISDRKVIALQGKIYGLESSIQQMLRLVSRKIESTCSNRHLRTKENTRIVGSRLYCRDCERASRARRKMKPLLTSVSA